jgi:hypothetical protein
MVMVMVMVWMSAASPHARIVGLGALIRLQHIEAPTLLVEAPPDNQHQWLTPLPLASSLTLVMSIALSHAPVILRSPSSSSRGDFGLRNAGQTPGRDEEHMVKPVSAGRRVLLLRDDG